MDPPPKTPVRTTPRVGMKRMRQPPNKGECKVVAIETHHTAQLASVFGRVLHPRPAQSFLPYSGAWRNQILHRSQREPQAVFCNLFGKRKSSFSLIS